SLLLSGRQSRVRPASFHASPMKPIAVSMTVWPEAVRDKVITTYSFPWVQAVSCPISHRLNRVSTRKPRHPPVSARRRGLVYAVPTRDHETRKPRRGIACISDPSTHRPDLGGGRPLRLHLDVEHAHAAACRDRQSCRH